jgi:hypothetical protein
MRIPLIYKRIGNFLGSLLLSLCCFFGAYQTLTLSSYDIDQINNYSGKVIEAGIMNKNNSVAGRGSFKSDIFFIKIQGLNQILATYNSSNSYGYFEENIKVGDKITVYYLESKDTIKPNLNLFQIEKNHKIILNTKEFQNKEILGGIIGFFGGIILLGLGLYQDKKYWRKNEK